METSAASLNNSQAFLDYAWLSSLMRQKPLPEHPSAIRVIRSCLLKANSFKCAQTCPVESAASFGDWPISVFTQSFLLPRKIFHVY